MTRGRSVLVDALEAAYDLSEEGGETAWAMRLLEALRPKLDAGFGLGTFVSDATRKYVPLAGLGLADGWSSRMEALMLSPEAKALLRPKRPASTASDAVGKRMFRAAQAMESWRELGAHDGVGLVAADGTENLLTLFAPTREVGSLPPGLTKQYARVAAHMLAGWRLRRHLGKRLSAVMTPSGTVVHAEGRARDRSMRDELRAAALRIDRARGKLRRTDEDEALELWRVLVAGEWSLVDQFDSDGRRYIVACENEPRVTDPRALSLRERQVLACSALGHASKLIAYELGLALSTVIEARTGAMRKLRLRSHADVVRLFAPAPGERPDD